ncbi:acetylglutamate kinase [Streptococcus dentiloxodontae]
MSTIIVIKIGGLASQKLSHDFVNQLKDWQAAGQQIVIVHGGGFAITETLEAAGVVTRKVNGLRVTAKEDMNLISYALLDLVGKGILETLSEAELEAKQIDLQSTVEAVFLDQAVYGYVGQVSKLNPEAIKDSLNQGQIPVLASLGYSTEEELLNINADYLATAVAVELAASKLILMTDVKGVLENNRVLAQLSTKDAAEKIAVGVIRDGMIPKIESAVKTVEAGVQQVVIGDSLTAGTSIIRE